jgi:hypothetical protein
MFLANASIPASTNSNVELVLISAGVVLVTAILGLVPIQIAKMRGHLYRDSILAATILWGLALAGTISYSTMQQMDWSATYQQRLMSGYSDPNDLSDKPKIPVALWTGLGAGYAAIVLWSAISIKPTADA